MALKCAITIENRVFLTAAGIRRRECPAPDKRRRLTRTDPFPATRLRVPLAGGTRDPIASSIHRKAAARTRAAWRSPRPAPATSARQRIRQQRDRQHSPKPARRVHGDLLPGSSIASRNSKKSATQTTRIPATPPTIMAAAGFSNAAAALLATRPAIHPLAMSDASGRPNLARVTTAAVNPDAAAQTVVLTAISTTRPGSTPKKQHRPGGIQRHPSDPREHASEKYHHHVVSGKRDRHSLG